MDIVSTSPSPSPIQGQLFIHATIPKYSNIDFGLRGFGELNIRHDLEIKKFVADAKDFFIFHFKIPERRFHYSSCGFVLFLVSNF